jgi:acyl-CoA thioester hydrolase
VSAEREADQSSVFETYVRVRFHEVDALGHVNNAAYLNYIEQAAIDHATFLGLDVERLRALGGVFVARRHEIVFLRPTFAGDVLRVVTWLSEPRGARVDRNYRIFREEESPAAVPIAGRVLSGPVIEADETLVLRAVTEWVFASEQGQPRRIPAAIMARFRPGEDDQSVAPIVPE